MRWGQRTSLVHLQARTGGIRRQHDIRVGQHCVDLPRSAVGIRRPHLVLHGKATGRLFLDPLDEPVIAQTTDRIGDFVDRHDFDAEVVETARCARAGDEYQFQRWFGNREVGVAGFDLGRRSAEELRVEVDGRIEVAHVESELHTGHGWLLY